MSRLVCGIALVGCLFLIGGPTGAADKDAPVRGQLPTGWKKLGLNDAQVKTIYTARAKYRNQIAELEAKIKELKAQERTELEKVLTDAQKARLREILLEKAPAPTKKESPK